jgi:hypothetical protein
MVKIKKRPKPEAILPVSAASPSGAGLAARRCMVRIERVLPWGSKERFLDPEARAEPDVAIGGRAFTRATVFSWMDGWSNRVRLHSSLGYSSLGYSSPVMVEAGFLNGSRALHITCTFILPSFNAAMFAVRFPTGASFVG